MFKTHPLNTLFLSLIVSTKACFGEESLPVFARVVSVYDGDTFRVDIESWPRFLGKDLPIRVKGVDTPEMKGKCLLERKKAREAKEYTTYFLKSSKTVTLSNLERGKFFRVLADVEVAGRNLSRELIERELGVPY
ncbi:thermonuclease family protein [Grimontia marina]|uniref:TNase-like domain-containing protein n=1 Tax=Grimontia marina TaxID=646534 RepID=A0A128FJ64_9GAMM|nr:thermonuclease family protein [Grimontia marina]CZF86829.1 hypothetical protein GMA8713_04868 [Grimontia marina]